MLVVSNNLLGIVNEHGICSPSLVEEFSLGVRLHGLTRRTRNAHRALQPVVFGHPYNAEDYFEPLTAVERDLELAPGQSVLGCSSDRYEMPAGYFGLMQTRGSLARLFVSVTCNDGQIEPGYEGRITLEITNHGCFPVVIPVGARVGQIFVFRCTTEVNKPYGGRYQGASEPTLAQFDAVDPGDAQ
ncbi:MAG: dCTP deaminase [Allosphingosinicella sp.]